MKNVQNLDSKRPKYIIIYKKLKNLLSKAGTFNEQRNQRKPKWKTHSTD